MSLIEVIFKNIFKNPVKRVKTSEEMRQETIWNLSDIKLFLVIATILLSICTGFLLAEAKETDNNNKWEDAELLIPNEDSKFNTFSFYRDRDWYKFEAEQGVTYQIFTCPVKEKNLPEIVMRLFSDPTGSSIAYNRDIRIDGSAFVEWFCPAYGEYFIRLQALDPYTYGDQDAYAIQITSIECQDANTIILDVPDYSQSDFGNFWDCKAVAAACVLGYWDKHGYGLLVDWNPDRIEDMTRLVSGLHDAMVYSMEISPLKILRDENVCEGIEFYCNIPKYGNNYNFAVEYHPSPAFSQVTNEIENKRPVLFGVVGHPLFGNHWMVTVGYLKTETTEWTINHDNWSTTDKGIYIDWDEATDCIITIHPDRKKVLITTYPNIYSPVYQYAQNPMVFPWLEPLPIFSFGMINPFIGINNISIPSWSSPLTTGYLKNSKQFDLGGGAGIVYSSNPESYNDQRYMAENINFVSDSPYGYNNPIGYNSAIGNNYTSGNSSIISNPALGTFLGSDLSVYSFKNIPFQGTIALLNSPFISPYQTLFPVMGLLPYNVFSPLPSFSPLLFSFDVPF